MKWTSTVRSFSPLTTISSCLSAPPARSSDTFSFIAILDSSRTSFWFPFGSGRRGGSDGGGWSCLDLEPDNLVKSDLNELLVVVVVVVEEEEDGDDTGGFVRLGFHMALGGQFQWMIELILFGTLGIRQVCQ